MVQKVSYWSGNSKVQLFLRNLAYLTFGYLLEFKNGKDRDRGRKWQPTPVLLPRKFHGWRSLVGYSPRGHKELDTTERLHER